MLLGDMQKRFKPFNALKGMGSIGMVEGRGFSGRREERIRAQRLRKFIEEKDDIIVVPDIAGEKITEKTRIKRKRE